MTEEHLLFVRVGWVRSFKNSYYAGVIPMHRYDDIQFETVDEILGWPDVEVVVAENPHQDDRTLRFVAFICHETGSRRPIVHYVYVEHDYKERGLVRGLFRAAGINPEQQFIHSHQTQDGKRRLRNFHGRHDPFYGRRPREKRRPE